MADTIIDRLKHAFAGAITGVTVSFLFGVSKYCCWHRVGNRGISYGSSINNYGFTDGFVMYGIGVICANDLYVWRCQKQFG